MRIQTSPAHYRDMHHGFSVFRSRRMESILHRRPVIKRSKSGMSPNENVCTHLTITPTKCGVSNTVPIATKWFPYPKIEVSICTIVPLISLNMQQMKMNEKKTYKLNKTMNKSYMYNVFKKKNESFSFCISIYCKKVAVFESNHEI